MIDLVQQRIKEFKQDNPFNSEGEHEKWNEYNELYKKELWKYVGTYGYRTYFDKVLELENNRGQLSFWE